MALTRWLVLLVAIVVGRPSPVHAEPVDRIVLVAAAAARAEASVAETRASRATPAHATPPDPLPSWSPAPSSRPLASLQNDRALTRDRWLRHCSLLC